MLLEPLGAALVDRLGRQLTGQGEQDSPDSQQLEQFFVVWCNDESATPRQDADEVQGFQQAQRLAHWTARNGEARRQLNGAEMPAGLVNAGLNIAANAVGDIPRRCAPLGL